MSEQLLRYYDRELAYLRGALADYAQRQPQHAAQLKINQSHIEDPNIARLVDAMALLSAKTEQRLDKRFPELAQGLLSVLYPGYTQSYPSYCAVTLPADPEQLSDALTLPKGSELSLPLGNGEHCLFSTCDALNIQPFMLTEVAAQAAPFTGSVPADAASAEAVIELQLECCDPESGFHQLDFQHFDFYVRGFAQSSDSLIELLLSNTQAIAIDAGEKQLLISPERLVSRVGDPDFQWLPRYGNQFSGFDMLRDYFAYPDKGGYFRILDLGGELTQCASSQLRLKLYLCQLPSEYLRLFTTDVFHLHTVPALNLFKQAGEPLRYDFTKLHCPVFADAYQMSSVEVVAIDQVSEVSAHGETPLAQLYQQRYDFGQNSQLRQWQGQLRLDEKGQRQWQITLSSQSDDLTSQPLLLSLDLTCSNGRAPCQAAQGSAIDCLASIDLPGQLQILNAPSAPQAAQLDDSLGWRTIALLNANFATLLQTEQPEAALGQVLSLCSRQVPCRAAEAVRKVEYLQRVASMTISGQQLFTTGTEVNLSLDSQLLGNQFAVFSQLLNGLYQQFCSYDRFVQLNIQRYGSDASKISFSRVHGSQLCL